MTKLILYVSTYTCLFLFINCFILHLQTRVFTPVIGSCTSVTVNNSMTVPHVIRTLLEKFKVSIFAFVLHIKNVFLLVGTIKKNGAC